MRRVFLVLVVFVAVSAGLVAIVVLKSGAPPGGPEYPHDLILTIPYGNLYGGVNFGRQLEISPDGKQVVYVGQSGKGSRVLFVHAIDEATPIEIPGTGVGNRDIRDPTFSPDGRFVAYWAQGTVKKVAVDGTSSSVIAETPSTRGISWLDSNTLVLGSVEGGLRKVSASQRTLPLVASMRADLPHVSPQVLPGSKAVVFTIVDGPLLSARIWVVNLQTGEMRQLFAENGFAPRYVSSGHLVFARGPNRELMAVRFDLSALAVVGSPQPVLDVRLFGTGNGGSTDYAVSETGVLVYMPFFEADSETFRAWFGDPTQIYLRLNWFEDLKRRVP